MKEEVNSKLIKRYTDGHYSFHDLKQIARWFEEVPYHNNLKSVLDQHWKEFRQGKTDDEKDLSLVFDRLKIRILSERSQRNTVEKFRRIYMRVAAILLVPLCVYAAFSFFDRTFQSFLNDQWIEVVAPKGTRTHFGLPDGTRVSLNSATHFMYRADFLKDRRVRMNGEAYFDVVHNDKSPFIVQTDDMGVKVLGTKFSVTSIKEEDLTEVILEEGKVQLTGKNNSFLIQLHPNEGFFYNKKAHSGEIKAVDAGTLTAWREGMLIFRSEPLGNVLKRIGRWYGVRFEVLDKEVEQFKYRATFHDEPLEEVLRLISLTAPIAYKINNRDVNKDGLYGEKVITIGLKKKNVSIK